MVTRATNSNTSKARQGTVRFPNPPTSGSIKYIVVSGNPQEQELYYEGNFDLADKIWSNHYLKVLEKIRHSYFKLNVI